MNFSASAKFTGLNASVAAKTFQTAARLSVEQSAVRVLDTAQSIVHVDSGDLRESGHIEIEQSGNTVSGHVVFDSDHAAYNEWGTGIRGAASPSAGDGPYDPNWPGMAAIPFARPALDQERPAIAEIFRDNTAAAAKLLGKR